MKIRSLPTRRALPVAALAAGLTLAAGAPSVAASTTSQSPATRPVFTVMTGAMETPPTGSHGIGAALFTVNAAKGMICYHIAVANLTSPVTAAHIHKGAPGVAGPVVVPLTPPTKGFVHDCAKVAPALAADIAGHPGNYYANVHTTMFPKGEVRGQLRG